MEHISKSRKWEGGRKLKVLHEVLRDVGYCDTVRDVEDVGTQLHVPYDISKRKPIGGLNEALSSFTGMQLAPFICGSSIINKSGKMGYFYDISVAAA